MNVLRLLLLPFSLLVACIHVVCEAYLGWADEW